MKTILLETESYLFENAEGRFRSIPFYELSMGEWVIYENGEPQYFLDLNRRKSPLVQEIKAKISRGQKPGDIIEALGKTIGKEWAIHYSVNATEIPGTRQKEVIELELLDHLPGIE